VHISLDVVKPSPLAARFSNDHINADVKECFPGALVVDFAEVAARYSNARLLKPRLLFSSSAA